MWFTSGFSPLYYNEMATGKLICLASINNMKLFNIYRPEYEVRLMFIDTDVDIMRDSGEETEMHVRNVEQAF